MESGNSFPIAYTSDMTFLRSGDWIDAAEAAEMIGITKRRVLAIIEKDKARIPSATMIGKSYLMLRKDVEKFAKLARPRGRPKRG